MRLSLIRMESRHIRETPSQPPPFAQNENGGGVMRPHNFASFCIGSALLPRSLEKPKNWIGYFNFEEAKEKNTGLLDIIAPGLEC